MNRVGLSAGDPTFQPPPSFDVVDVETAQSLINDVRASLDALELELDAAEREADEAESRALGAPEPSSGANPLVAEFRDLAEQVRAAARADAARILQEARNEAANLLGASGPADAVPATGTVLRLAE